MTNHKIEGNLNFYDELYKSLDDSDDDETKERKAKEFVDSLEHILEMMEENNDNRVEDV